MTRRDWTWTCAALATLALLLSVLHCYDRRRAHADLLDLERSLCEGAVTARERRVLGHLHLPAARGGRAAEIRRTVDHLDGRLVHAGRLEVFFEADATLWIADPYYDPRPQGAHRWPQAIGRWEEVAGSEGCRSAIAGTRLHAARTLHLPGRGFVVLLATRWRDID